jgi:dUTP pyrophosphatase
MKIFVEKIIPDAKVPERATNGAIGYDVFACRVLDKKSTGKISKLPLALKPGQSALIGIGIKFAVPFPYQCEIRPRSGLAIKHNIEIINSPGTIDPDYRGEGAILLLNHGKKVFTVKKDMRIAQMIFSKTQTPILEVIEKLPTTLRNTGGFGSTGLMKIKEGTSEYSENINELDIFYMKMAIAASRRSNCARGCKKDRHGKYLRDSKGRLIGQTRRFGCVIVNDDNVISFGFNAQVTGQAICAEVGCLRDLEKIPSGTKIERCRAVHAEEMAITKMIKSGVGASTKGATMYCTSEPCEVCAKTIAEAGFEALVVLNDVYPQNGVKIVEAAGIEVRLIKKNDLEE